MDLNRRFIGFIKGPRDREDFQGNPFTYCAPPLSNLTADPIQHLIPENERATAQKVHV